MTVAEMVALFTAESDEYFSFSRIVAPRHRRPDICAFLMLDDLLPGDSDIIAYARHDEFFLSINPEALAAVATPEFILDLRRCGVRYDVETESLAMFA
jgi:hypothetical protein